MEVKSVYMDLVEWVKTRGVWKLESEAFKKPIEIKIWYDNTELQQFNNRCDELESRLKNTDFEINVNKADIERVREDRRNLADIVRDQQSQLDELKEKLNEEVREKSELYKMIADLKTTVETLSGTILHLQEQTKENTKKITKQPSVFHDKCFISGRENVWLGVFSIENGDYLMILKTVVWEHNEYVTNKDELIMEKVHVDNETYVPFYKLEWGTELDLPTATIYYDLVFMPI